MTLYALSIFVFTSFVTCCHCDGHSRHYTTGTQQNFCFPRHQLRFYILPSLLFSSSFSSFCCISYYVPITSNLFINYYIVAYNCKAKQAGGACLVRSISCTFKAYTSNDFSSEEHETNLFYWRFFCFDAISSYSLSYKVTTLISS